MCITIREPTQCKSRVLSNWVITFINGSRWAFKKLKGKVHCTSESTVSCFIFICMYDTMQCRLHYGFSKIWTPLLRELVLKDRSCKAWSLTRWQQRKLKKVFTRNSVCCGGRGSLSLQERIARVLIFQLFVSFTVFKIEAPKGIKDECY